MLAAAIAMNTTSATPSAQLDRNLGFSFESWGEAVRAGRTFTTSGALIDLVVDGHPRGSEIRMSSKGGEVEVCTCATSVCPSSQLTT